MFDARTVQQIIEAACQAGLIATDKKTDDSASECCTKHRGQNRRATSNCGRMFGLRHVARLPQTESRIKLWAAERVDVAGALVHLGGAGADAGAVEVELHVGMIGQQRHGYR